MSKKNGNYEVNTNDQRIIDVQPETNEAVNTNEDESEEMEVIHFKDYLDNRIARTKKNHPIAVRRAKAVLSGIAAAAVGIGSAFLARVVINRFMNGEAEEVSSEDDVLDFDKGWVLVDSEEEIVPETPLVDVEVEEPEE